MPYEPKYRYIPSVPFHILTRIDHIICSVFGLGKKFKQSVLSSVAIPKNAVIVDIGCGTGIFLEIAKKIYPDVNLIGIDPDKQSLEIARNRLKRIEGKIDFIGAFAESLPLQDNSTDICFSTLMLHHVPDEIKLKALKEMHRILKSGGKVVIADFGKSDSWLIRKILVLFFFEKLEYIDGNFRGSILKYLEECGFRNISVVGKKFPEINIITADK
jgi:ubiquinone/menaquinone biosynthesis C-methylase UbiE